MGYYIEVVSTNFSIKNENQEKALAAVKSLAGKETIEDGGGRHFSWVTTSDFLSATTLRLALVAWRWNTEVDEDGNITDLYFTGQKLGDDEILFTALAPYVEPDSFIEFRGEDGAQWRYVFKNSVMKEVTGRMTWEEE